MSCSCGSSCQCGSNCKCGKEGYSEFGYLETATASATVVLGVPPQKTYLEGFETSGAENGCKCGSSCTCDPCNCK